MRRCYRCATQVPERELLCPHCGSGDITTGMIRPTMAPAQDVTEWPWPWRGLVWPPGSAMVLVGGKGLGKTSLGLTMDPDVWLSTEQEPVDVLKMANRLHPEIVGRLRIGAIPGDLEALEEMLAHADREEMVILDSLAEFGNEALGAMKMIREWAQKAGGRALAVQQITKAGKAGGREAIVHEADIVAEVSGEDSGRRRLALQKCRFGPLVSALYEFGNDGRLICPELLHAYSVEGRPGSYRLCPVPTRGAKWQGVYKELDPDIPITGTASCGRPWPAYPTGWLLPEDLRERRRFAETHGLKWITPPPNREE